MKHYNSAHVYYFIYECIRSSYTEIHLKKCQILINNIAYKNYAFTGELVNELLVRHCEILINRYAIYE
jgi:hypothetical protein